MHACVRYVSLSFRAPGGRGAVQQQCRGAATMENRALKRFVERRMSPSAAPIPGRPQGRADYASLELLSGVALEQLRKSAAASTAPDPQRCSAFAPSARPVFGKERPSATSPVTLYPKRPDALSSHSALRDAPLDDSQRGEGQALGRRPPFLLRKSSSGSQSSSEQQGTPRSGACYDNKFQASRVVKRGEKESAQAMNKARCQSSRFCHICSRTTRKVNNICCANYYKGTCRKVVCEKCFKDYGWDWDAASKAPMEWACTHCSNVCPPRAQCAIYRRTNERRRETQQRLRHPRAFVLDEDDNPPADARSTGGRTREDGHQCGANQVDAMPRRHTTMYDGPTLPRYSMYGM